jgi:hypothetical protein
MGRKRVWSIINVSLVLICVLLLLTFFSVELPTLGKAQYAFDSSQELCVALFEGEEVEWDDIHRCCLEARKQLMCNKEMKETAFGITQFTCQTGASSTSLQLNSKAYNYCQLQAFW